MQAHDPEHHPQLPIETQPFLYGPALSEMENCLRDRRIEERRVWGAAEGEGGEGEGGEGGRREAKGVHGDRV